MNAEYRVHFIPYMIPMWAVVVVYDNSTSSVYSTHDTFEEAIRIAAVLNPSHGLGMRVV